MTRPKGCRKKVFCLVARPLRGGRGKAGPLRKVLSKKRTLAASLRKTVYVYEILVKCQFFFFLLSVCVHILSMSISHRLAHFFVFCCLSLSSRSFLSCPCVCLSFSLFIDFFLFIQMPSVLFCLNQNSICDTFPFLMFIELRKKSFSLSVSCLFSLFIAFSLSATCLLLVVSLSIVFFSLFRRHLSFSV